MAKLPRTTQKIFAKNAAAGQITTFGSIKDGSPVYSTSASAIMNSNFEGGWSSAVEDDYAPYRQDRNAVDTAVTQQLAYLFQEGIPEYDSGTVYYKGSICKVTDGTGVKIYKSIYDNHSAAVTNTNRWHLILNVDSTNTIVSPSISSPTISGGSMSNGTFSNPTFSGTVNVPLASASSSTTSTIAASLGWVNDPNLSSNVVHKTGTETISGSKTFSSNLVVSKTAPRIYIDNTDYTKGTAPSSTIASILYSRDNANAIFGGISQRVDTSLNGATRVSINKQTTSSAYGALDVCYNVDGKYYLDFHANNSDTGDVNNSLSKVTNSTTDTNIPTMGWVNNPATSTNIVHRSSTETISGQKTFVSSVITNATSNDAFVNLDSTITKGTTPSSNKLSRWRWCGSGGTSNTYALGGVEFGYTASGTITSRLQAFKPEANSTTNASIDIYYPSSGDPYTNAPTPTDTTSTSSLQIATVGWANTTGNNLVHLTGSETISGGKTFTSNVYLTKSGPVYVAKNPDVTKGTAPDSTTSVQFLVYQDSAGKGMSAIQSQYAANKNVATQIYTYKGVSASDTEKAVLSINYNANGQNGLYWNGDNDANNVSMTSTSTSTTSNIIPTLGLINTRLAARAVVTESYINGDEGYRIWSDGYIEQWGHHTYTSTSWQTVTLFKAYADNKYSVVGVQSGDSTSLHDVKVGYTDNTTTTFQTKVSTSGTGLNWRTFGMGA